MQELTLHSAALWNTQQTFFEYMADTGRNDLVEKIRPLMTKVKKRDDKRLPVDCMVNDVTLMRTVADEAHMTVNMVERNKGVLQPLFTALRSWQTSEGLPEDKLPIPLYLFVQLCGRYWGLNNQIAKFSVVQANGCFEITLDPADPDRFHPTIGEGVILGLIKAVRDNLAIYPKSVYFPHEKPLDYQKEEFLRFMGVEPKFSKKAIIIRYEDEEYDFEITNRIISMLGHLNGLHSVQFPEVSIVQRTEWLMEQLMPITEPTKCLVAKILNVSVSTLERRLKAENTCFKTLLLRLKKELAVEYLIKLNKSASKTSSLLGYTSSAQFFKAFKQWFGQTPNEYKTSFIPG